MSDSSEPQGCLVAILSLFGIRRGLESVVPDRLPYRQRDDFLSAAELSYYRVLTLSVGDSYVVCPKVNLADLFFVPRSNENQSYRNKIDRKHVDFVLCDPSSMKPVLGIELDDASHERRDRQDRDKFVGQVFEAAGLPLIRVRAAAAYRPQVITDSIREAVAPRKALNEVIESRQGTPNCPKCGSPMMLRTAAKGSQKGVEFWGCRNYPKCREIAKI